LPYVTEKVESAKSSNVRPVDIQAGPAGGSEYSVLGALDFGRQWSVHYDLSAEELLAAIARYRRIGWRPDAVGTRWDGRFRYMLVVVDNHDDVDWRFRMDMSVKEYQKESAEQKRQGMIPLALCSYGDDDAIQYGAVWVRYRNNADGMSAQPAEKKPAAVSWSDGGPKQVLVDPAHALYDVLDVRDIAAAERKEFNDWRAALGPDFRIACLSARGGSGVPMFNAVALREKQARPFDLDFDLAGEAIDQTAKRRSENRRPLVLCDYVDPSSKAEFLEAQLWVNDDLGTEFFNWSSSLPFVRGEVERGKAGGFRPIYLDVVAIGQARWFRAVQARDQGRRWKAYYTLSARDLIPLIEYYQRKGWRPDVLAPYWDSTEFRFMLVVVDNSDRVDWRFRLGMSRQEYRTETEAQKRHGLMPLAIAAYGDDADVRVAAVWVRYRVPE